MKSGRKAIRITTYVAGIFVIASSAVVAVLLIMSSLGIIFPRKLNITLYTKNITYTYDGNTVYGGQPEITYGYLIDGHRIKTLSESGYEKAGSYENRPEYAIFDSAGADVTDMYEITEDFGTVTVKPRPVTVYSPSKEKPYDGTELVSDEIVVIGGKLAEGHTFNFLADTRITLPGVQEIAPSFTITDINGADVTDQYKIENRLGSLTVHPIAVTVSTDSATKVYDGTALEAPIWTHTDGYLLDGHTLEAKCTASATEVGVYDNTAVARVTDADGNDVSYLYEIFLDQGLITITPIELYIKTGSASKEYDGKPLSCDEWKILTGNIKTDESIKIINRAETTKAGTVKNELEFVITDKNGTDITNRYRIILDTGTLTVTQRSVSIRTGSATKVYDGTALICDEYEIIQGSLCEGDKIEFTFTSITNIGYTQNYVLDQVIYTVSDDGTKTDVSANYKIIYDYGTITVIPE